MFGDFSAAGDRARVGESRGRAKGGESRGESGESRGESGGRGGQEVIRKEARAGESGRVGESRGESGRVGESRGESGAGAGGGGRGSGNLAGDWFGGPELVWWIWPQNFFLNFLRKYKSADAKGISRHHADRSA